MQEAPKRLRIGIAALIVLVTSVVMAGVSGTATAGAQNGLGFDPQGMNVPYLAWRGTDIRLVKCVEEIEGLRSIPGGITGFVGTFTVEDWSGDPHFKPQFAAAQTPISDAGDATATYGFEGMGPEQGGRTCFSADMVSQKPGLAIVKLKISEGPFFGGGGNRVVLEHQFLAGWMNISQTNVEDIGPSSVPASTDALNGEGLCTPPQPVDLDGDEPPEIVTSNCPDVATPATTAAAQNQVQAIVSGTIPMLNNFDEINAQLGRAAGTPLTMPNDWDELASVMARTRFPGFERSEAGWDIHDEFTAVPGGATPSADDIHQAGGRCSSGGSTTMDEVDNCVGTAAEIRADIGEEFEFPLHELALPAEFGPFSRFIHPFATGLSDVTTVFTGNPTIGPYDPLRTDTYLPNGVTDEGDAPMPTARVDFVLDGNVGLLVPIDKHAVYDDNPVHPLWAPFYGRFIPATAAEDALGKTSSGEDGGFGNNFNSYQTRGLYHYWDFAVALERSGAAIDCPDFEPGIPASEAFGTFTVSTYTDEHGEARVGFNGGVGFPASVPSVNANGCDLLGVTTLGTARIFAIARYPHQMVTAADVPGDEVVNKTVTSLFNKDIDCVGKVPGVPLSQQVAFICTITARGVAGGAFAGETVCVGSNAEMVRLFGDTVLAPTPAGRVGPAVICVVLDANGTAELEVFGKGNLNLIAEFIDEGIVRVRQFAGLPLGGASGGPAPGVGGTGGTTPPPPPPPPPPAVGGVTGGTSTPPSLGGTGKVNAPKPTARPAVQARVLSARIIETKSGRKLTLRIKSAKATSKVRIVLKSRNGKVLAAAVRTVRTNRVVTVPNLRIVRGAVRISVSTLS